MQLITGTALDQIARTFLQARVHHLPEQCHFLFLDQHILVLFQFRIIKLRFSHDGGGLGIMLRRSTFGLQLLLSIQDAAGLCSTVMLCPRILLGERVLD